MTTKAEQSIEVNVPVSTAYGQWTQFEDFPHFMGGIKEVRQLDDRRLHWVAEIAGVRREWEASILEQVPDQKVSWAATSGATNAGEVRFTPAGAGSTMVHLTLEYEPEGMVEQIGDKLGIVQRQVTNDLERFKKLIEDQGYASGAWRGTIEGAGLGTPGVEAAAASEGDSGKAGVSGKAVAAGVAVVAGGIAAATALSGSEDTSQEQPVETASIAPPVMPATPVMTETPVVTETSMTPVTDEIVLDAPATTPQVVDVDEATSPSRTV